MEGSIGRRDATKQEIQDLRHVVDEIPRTVWLVAFAGAAQRFAYYGTIVPWREFQCINATYGINSERDIRKLHSESAW